MYVDLRYQLDFKRSVAAQFIDCIRSDDFRTLSAEAKLASQPDNYTEILRPSVHFIINIHNKFSVSVLYNCHLLLLNSSVYEV